MLKRQEQKKVEAALAVVLLCASFYIHLIHKFPERHGINFNLIPFYKEENIKKLDNSFQATQLLRDTDGK